MSTIVNVVPIANATERITVRRYVTQRQPDATTLRLTDNHVEARVSTGRLALFHFCLLFNLPLSSGEGSLLP